MRPAASRLLVGACAAATALGRVAAPAPAAPSPPALCAARAAVGFTDAATDGDVHRITVVLTSTGNAACTLAGFPALVLPSAHDAPLPAGRLTVAREVVLAPRSPASFGIRYVTSQAVAPAPCSLGVVLNGSSAATDGTIPLAACASITQIDVTSYASGAQPPAVARVQPPSADVAPCAAHDLALREVRTGNDGELAPYAIYALQNRGAAPCRIAGAVGIRLLDASGKAFPLRFAVRTLMAMLLTVPPGYEASFSVAYSPHAAQRCPASTSIAVFVPAQTEAVTAPATLAACTGPDVRVGNLRLGIALPPSAFGTEPARAIFP